MTPPTDTIPEASKAATQIHLDATGHGPSCDWEKTIAEACLSYHARRLAECGSGKETIKAIALAIDLDTNEEEKILQAHTARAVEEATKSYIKEIDFLTKQHLEFQMLWSLLPEIENQYQERLVVHLREKFATLQKQCKELHEWKESAMKEMSEWKAQDIGGILELQLGSHIAPQVLPAIKKLKDERDSLRTRADQERELHTMQLAAIMTASIQNTESTIKDRIGSEHPYCTVAYQDVCRAIDREIRERTRAEAAEAEVAELKKRYPHMCRDEHQQIGHADSSHEMCPLCRANSQLSTLQQDVRPLVELLQKAAKFSVSKPDYWASCSQCEHHKDDAQEALTAFLEKHPELSK